MPARTGSRCDDAHQVRLLSRPQASPGRCALPLVRDDGGVSKVVRGESAGLPRLCAAKRSLGQMPESKFIPAQAEELATAFAEAGVDYLFIGKSAAILLGYPD